MKRAATLAIIAALAMGSLNPALAKHHKNNQLQLQQQQLLQQQQVIQMQQAQLQQQQLHQAQVRQAQEQRRLQHQAWSTHPVAPYWGQRATPQQIQSLRQQIANTMDAGQKAALIGKLQYLEGKRSRPTNR
jgi:hypothetical protein